MGADTEEELAQKTVEFEPLEQVFLPLIVEKAWEGTVRQLVPRDIITLEREEIDDTIADLFDQKLGWQDRPHLSKYAFIMLLVRKFNTLMIGTWSTYIGRGKQVARPALKV